MKTITKALMGAGALVGVLANTPAVHAAIASLIGSHPYLSTVGAVLAFVGALLHQPTKGNS